MPYSDSEGKDTALAWYEEIRPRTVIDIGAGSGTYARALRGHSPWKGRWTAVEVWEPYVDQFDLRTLYNAVVVADARHVTPSFYRADLVVAGDVLEHLTHAHAVTLLNKIKAYAANLIVSVPVLHLNQDTVYGNPHERHIDHWTAHAMRTELSRSGTIRSELVGDVLAYYWWSP